MWRLVSRQKRSPFCCNWHQRKKLEPPHVQAPVGQAALREQASLHLHRIQHSPMANCKYSFQLPMFIAIFTLVALSSCWCEAYSYGSSSSSFVQTRGSQFVLDGRPLYVNGFNAYYLSYAAIDSPEEASNILQQAAGMGLTLCRTWAFKDGGYHAMQVSPGVYDESAFKALDFVLKEAARHGMRVILSLVDNYQDMGGKAQYVQWAREAGVSIFGGDDEFFTNPVVKSYFKNYVKDVIMRVNTFTGVAYKDDPTIFAWELMNEPRCPSDRSGDALHGWIEEMSSYVKSIDGNHMVEAGLEGFYGPWSEDKQHFNPPGANLATGTDYIRFSQISTIDFTTVHSYPDIWLGGQSFEQQLEFFKAWVGAHMSDGSIVKKPLLFTEFGLSKLVQGSAVEERRVALFSALYATVYSSAMNGGPVAGALVWQLCTQAVEGTMVTDGYGVSSLDSSLTSLISLQSQKLSELSR
ncbi:hypothetical protein KP509_03G063200 [Ceratopteris richardii]|uniref:mannan endo-1,4-beta-mannosidase n=1 Tax=Ceratopteris richardii TaxID=49495 RepID=A0A8T2V812_CERRI|nr:hypothetical protein KP509_03G063200 [Ceratopteris richardii]